MVKVSNENEVAAYHVIRVFLAVIFVAYLAAIWAFPEYFSWSDSKTVRVIGHSFASIYLLATLYLALRGGMWFVEFIHANEAYEFRYYLLTTPFGSKRMTSVADSALCAFKIEKSVMGLKKTLILFQEKDDKFFQYPPIPIGCLLNEKQQQVIEELKKNTKELK